MNKKAIPSGLHAVTRKCAPFNQEYSHISNSPFFRKPFILLILLLMAISSSAGGQDDSDSISTTKIHSSQSQENPSSASTPNSPLSTKEFSDSLHHAIKRVRDGEYEIGLKEFQTIENASFFSSLQKKEDLLMAAEYWFYRAIAEHQMFLKNECENSLNKLDELYERSHQIQDSHSSNFQLPFRFKSLSKLMRKDLETLQDESLEMISRKMKNVERGLNLGEAGQKIQAAEEEIINMLDSMLEEMEQKAQKQKSLASRTLKPGKPMEKAQAAGGNGPGKVTPTKLKFDRNWGKLPEKEREEILQQLGRDFPPHYRQAIEQYFKKIAEEE